MKQIFIAALLLTTFCSFSQETDEPLIIQLKLPPGAVGVQSRDRENIVEGSPYLNEKHQIGTIINGENKWESLLRYNAYEDKFQILDENKQKRFLIKAPSIKVELDGINYQLVAYKESAQFNLGYYAPQTDKNKDSEKTKNGYFIALYEGTTKLYRKTSKKITKIHVPENGYDSYKPPKLVLDKGYYVKKAFKPAFRIELAKKQVLLALNNKYDEIRAYIKKHKLKVKTIEEVIQVITYYDTLN